MTFPSCNWCENNECTFCVVSCLLHTLPRCLPVPKPEYFQWLRMHLTWTISCATRVKRLMLCGMEGLAGEYQNVCIGEIELKMPFSHLSCDVSETEMHAETVRFSQCYFDQKVTDLGASIPWVSFHKRLVSCVILYQQSGFFFGYSIFLLWCNVTDLFLGAN